MSGFIVGRGACEPQALNRAVSRLSFSPEAHTEAQVHPSLFFAGSRFDDPSLWSVAHDRERGMSVMLAGRIALDPADWESARRLPFEGGAAGQYILDGVRRSGLRFLEHLNGAYAVALVNPGSAEITIATDRMGFIPVYMAHRGAELVVCTHADVLAVAAPWAAELDIVTMAEMLSHWHGVHPYTFYRGIKQLDAGTIHSWKAGETATSRRYWSPTYAAQPSASQEELGEELASAIRTSVRLRSQTLIGTAGVFLSGGADSRAVLFSSSEPSSVGCFTFYDEENAEFATARQLAAFAGARHVGLQRDPEHYGLGAQQAVRVMGGMWNLCDAHYTRFLPRLREEKMGVWLSGCFADYLFKGIAQDRRYRTLMGRALPLFATARFSHQWYFGHGSIALPMQALVEERCAQMYEGCRLDSDRDDDRWNIEMHRLWPISREATIGSRLLLTRTLPWDIVLSDRAVLDVMMKIPARLKLNGEVWNAAVRRICTAAAGVKNNNWGVTIGASKATNLSEFLWAVAKRKLTKFTAKPGSREAGLTTTGSWPDFVYYLTHSQVLRQMWEATPPSHRDVLNDILGFDAWGLSLDEWAARDVNQWYRAMTLCLWLDRG